MKSKLRYAKEKRNSRHIKSIYKNAKSKSKRQKYIACPETKTGPKLQKKRTMKDSKVESDELLVVGQGSEQVQLPNNLQLNILDINPKLEKRLKVLAPCSLSNNTNKLENAQSLEAKFKILSPHLKNTLNKIDEANYAAYDIDDKDKLWVELVNKTYCDQWKGFELGEQMFEWLIDQFERASKFQHHQEQPVMRMSRHKLEMVMEAGLREGGFCCICGDDGVLCHNNILTCQLCNISVHQECYGVPHIPEGAWICRACHLSPSHQVQCCLCPIKGGALKQTYEMKTADWEEGVKGWMSGETGEGGLRRWAHIACVAWIPEVLFANNVFLEPVDDIDKIAPARWKLKCVVCLRSGVGACIQCHKTGCYAAFHITCGILCALKMNMEAPNSFPFSSSSSSSIDLYLKSLSLSSVDSSSFKKIAYCPFHSLPKKTSTLHALKRQRDHMRMVRMLVRRNEAYLSITSLPFILPTKLEEIRKSAKWGQLKEVQGKDGVFEVVWRYWMMKRLFNNGAPLIASAHSYSLHPVLKQKHFHKSSPFETMREMTRLRQDFEKVRLLHELIRKREKLKRKEIDLRVEVTMGLLRSAQECCNKAHKSTPTFSKTNNKCARKLNESLEAKRRTETPKRHVNACISTTTPDDNLKLLADTAISHKDNSRVEVGGSRCSPLNNYVQATTMPCDSTTDWLPVEDEMGNFELEDEMGNVELVDEASVKKRRRSEGVDVGSVVWAPWAHDTLYPAKLLQVDDKRKRKSAKKDCLVLFYDTKKTSRWVEKRSLLRLEEMQASVKGKDGIEKAYHRAFQDHNKHTI